MKLGFTGTRSGMTDKQLESMEEILGDVCVFYHGSCKGADIQAARMVRQHIPDAHIIALPGPADDPCREYSGVDDEIGEGTSHFARNRAIVDKSDEIFAAPYDMKEARFGGTWYTIHYAIKRGKLVTIIWPDGCTEGR